MLIFLAVIMIMAAQASAIGIGPARIILNFTPSMVYTQEYSVMGSGLAVQLYVRGDLEQYVQCGGSSTVAAGSSAKFNCTISLPEWLPGPKRYDTRIGAMETAPSGGMIGAVAGVESQLWIDVPELPMPPGFELPEAPAESQPPFQSNGTAAEEQPQAGEQLVLTSESLGVLLIIIGAMLAIIVLLAAILLGHKRKLRER
jgi:hypothetical protein